MPAIRLTTLGDSFVEGRGDPAPDGGYVGWVSRFAAMLGIATTSVRNLGAYQATTEVVLHRQLPSALAPKAPLIGVVVGVNDLVEHYDPARFRRNLGDLFRALAGMDTTVFTANYPDIPENLPVPASYRRLLRDRFDEANATLREITSASGALCLDLASSPEWSDRAMWSADGLHPSPTGHQRFAEDMAGFIARTLGMTTAA